ncbi:hypothetical protein SAMN05421850_10452 [Lutimaribacter saemankumensis]|uniref:Uncharacterized protein n=1 Tax=Lutimaribacter saemankumensis TaxID=490829 RepID=A0A1G8M5G7_9RHOB|nr:hypothetical protein SAMN05421850_10452 [Lutimaribacter saemankumensis]
MFKPRPAAPASPKRASPLSLALVAALVGLSMMSAAMFIVQIYQQADCFNELDRCLDPETATVTHRQSGMAWLLLTVLALMAAACLFRRLNSPVR